MPEIKGTMKDGELWALVFADVPLFVKHETKIVWHMTSSPAGGDFHIIALGPGGEDVQPTWLEPHGGSSWARPGGEWGTGFTLPHAGCWDFQATMGKLTGDVWMQVR